LGRSGLPGYVDTHFWQRFGAAILISVIDGAIQAALDRKNSSSGGSAVVYNTQGFARCADRGAAQYHQHTPHVVKNQGERIQVFVGARFGFRPVYALGREQPQ